MKLFLIKKDIISQIVIIAGEDLILFFNMIKFALEQHEMLSNPYHDAVLVKECILSGFKNSDFHVGWRRRAWRGFRRCRIESASKTWE